MMQKIINALIAMVKNWFGIKDPPTEPSVAQVAADQAVAATQLHEERAANDIVEKASIARSTATASVMRDVAPAADDSDSTSTNATLKRDFPDDFRD